MRNLNTKRLQKKTAFLSLILNSQQYSTPSTNSDKAKGVE